MPCRVESPACRWLKTPASDRRSRSRLSARPDVLAVVKIAATPTRSAELPSCSAVRPRHLARMRRQDSRAAAVQSSIRPARSTRRRRRQWAARFRDIYALHERDRVRMRADSRPSASMVLPLQQVGEAAVVERAQRNAAALGFRQRSVISSMACVEIIESQTRRRHCHQPARRAAPPGPSSRRTRLAANRRSQARDPGSPCSSLVNATRRSARSSSSPPATARWNRLPR